jgi:hypothetical protein
MIDEETERMPTSQALLPCTQLILFRPDFVAFVLSQHPLTISSTLYHLTFGPIGLTVCLHAEEDETVLLISQWRWLVADSDCRRRARVRRAGSFGWQDESASVALVVIRVSSQDFAGSSSHAVTVSSTWHPDQAKG